MTFHFTDPTVRIAPAGSTFLDAEHYGGEDGVGLTTDLTPLFTSVSVTVQPCEDDYEWYDVTRLGDPEPRLLRGPCVHRYREAVISLGEHVADICLNPRCLAQIDVGWWS